MRLNFLDVPVTDSGLLPEYARPPVVEVSLGFQFTGLGQYSSLLGADFFDQVKRDYPLIEEHPPLDPAFETFGPSSPVVPIRFEVVSTPMQARFFFLSKDGSQLLQFQRDRLHYNWRKTDGSRDYPSYPSVRSNFEKAYKRLVGWASRHNLGPINISQCEIVYVNNIPLVDAAREECGLSTLFPWFQGLPGRTEDGNFQFRQRLVDQDGKPAARLTCTLQYGTDSSGHREARLMLLVRGCPNNATERDYMEFFDEGRKIIVHTFTNITTDHAHAMWGRLK